MSKRVTWRSSTPLPTALHKAGSRGRLAVLAAVVVLCFSSSWVFLYLQTSKTVHLRWQPLPALNGSACEPTQKPLLVALSRAALTAPWTAKLPYNRSASIPMQLWQTSRSSDIGDRARGLQQTWLNKNPGVPHTLMNDTEASAFIRTFYGSAVAAIYDAFPVGVMRGDFWRYAILYAYGGIYADVDTECVRPLSNWFPPLVRPGGNSESPSFAQGVPGAPQQLRYAKLAWQNCSLVIALENDLHLCQWIIAAAPGHPLMRSVLQAALRSVQDGFRCSYEHMVHVHTGPGVFTRGVREGLGLPDHYNAADIARGAWTNATVYQRARELGVCFVAGDFWGDYGGKKAQNAKNHFSSQWGGGNSTTIPSWTTEREQLVKQWVGGGGDGGGGHGKNSSDKG